MSSSQPTTSERIHGLDSLRAIAMILGIYLHGAIPYIRPTVDKWAIQDSQSSYFFTFSVMAIHAFRMQVFFLIAGFFAHLVIAKRGLPSFRRNRTRRILFPWLVSMVIIGFLMQLAWVAGTHVTDPSSTSYMADVITFYQEGGGWSFTLLWHLWFLEYLLLMYLATWLLCRYGKPFSVNWLDRLLRFSLANPLRPILIAVPVVAMMFLQPGWEVKAPLTVVPEWESLLYYTFFYSIGWWLYPRREILPQMARGGMTLLAMGVFVLLPLHLGAYVDLGDGTTTNAWKAAPQVDIWGRITYGFLTTFLTFGFMGIFLEWANRNSPAMRYVSDSSYWLYLLHLPIQIPLGILLLSWNVSCGLKFIVVLGSSTAILLVSYHYLVRSTFVGYFLNGRKVVRS